MPRVARVSDVKANLLSPATTSHFEVEIPIIDALSRWRGVGKQDKIALMCSETSLPGSNLATFEINNDRTGVTEKHVHRRIFDDRIDLTFYVDAGLYQPIKFFEDWMAFITNNGATDSDLLQNYYNYRMRYPDGDGVTRKEAYVAPSGLVIRKFEKDHQNILEYEFTRVFPLAINSMPVSYDASSLLKCTVSMSYVRYIVRNLDKMAAYTQNTSPQASSTGGTTNSGSNLGQAFTAVQQARFNVSGLAGGIVDDVVDRLTGNDALGDLAGGLTARFVESL